MVRRRRVVITGLGVLAPNGCGKESFWQACLQGRSGISGISRFDASMLPTRIAGEIRDFAPQAYGLAEQECARLDRGTQFALAAANLALKDARLNHAQLSEEERSHTGVYLGTAMASVEAGERLWRQLTGDGTHPPKSALYEKELAALMLSYVPSTTVATYHRLLGPCLTFATGCSAGTDAVGQAFWDIQAGRAERMLAGGTDAALSLLGVNVFCVMRALSTHNAEPTRASRPYDARRDGFVLSEGAAVLLLEEREIALARGAHIYAEIRAFASNSNAHHMTALPVDGTPLQHLLRTVIAEAHLSPEEIGYINSHGSSTVPNDAAETAAYKAVFGTHAYHIPISATKSLIGHTQGAAGAIEVLVTALALDQQMIPPTINLEVHDPDCDLDYVPHIARPVDPHAPLRFALTHSSGFGGVNAVLLLTRHNEQNFSNGEQYRVPQQAFSVRTAFPGKRSTNTSRRVVITGLGATAPNGIGTPAFWNAIRAGRSGISRHTHSDGNELPIQFAGTIQDFRAEDYVDRKLVQRTDRMTHLTLATVEEALQDAGLALDQEDPHRVGVVIANTLGGIGYIEQQLAVLYTRGPRAMSAYTAIAWLPTANSGQVSMRYGLQGYCKTPINDTCGGLDALGQAYLAIQRGVADVLIAGGCEAPLQPGILHVLGASLPLCAEDDPCGYRPFDARAQGLVIAEGAGICILEEYEHARRRGAFIYGEIIGYAQTCAPHSTAEHVSPDVNAYTRAFQQVLVDARLRSEEIACVYLDGRALPTWDRAEVMALYEIFGTDLATLPCSVPRTQWGHSLAAAGALDTLCALLALKEGLVPPTTNCEKPAGCPPGLVTGEAHAQKRSAQAALICARGLGGGHVTLAVRTV